MPASPRWRSASRRDVTPDQILAVADAEGASMIALGSRGLSDAKALLLGSVSHKVANRANCTCIARQVTRPLGPGPATHRKWLAWDVWRPGRGGRAPGGP